MSPSGKAQDFDSCIRRSESGHPSQKKALASTSAFFSYIRLRRVLLLCSDIRLTPSDSRFASLGGEYNITATTELQSNSEQYHCCLQQYHADTVSISLPIRYGICVYKCSACQEKRTENVTLSVLFLSVRVYCSMEGTRYAPI